MTTKPPGVSGNGRPGARSSSDRLLAHRRARGSNVALGGIAHQATVLQHSGERGPSGELQPRRSVALGAPCTVLSNKWSSSSLLSFHHSKLLQCSIYNRRYSFKELQFLTDCSVEHLIWSSLDDENCLLVAQYMNVKCEIRIVHFC